MLPVGGLQESLVFLIVGVGRLREDQLIYVETRENVFFIINTVTVSSSQQSTFINVPPLPAAAPTHRLKLCARVSATTRLADTVSRLSSDWFLLMEEASYVSNNRHDRLFYSECFKWFVPSLIMSLFVALMGSFFMNKPDERGMFSIRTGANRWLLLPDDSLFFFFSVLNNG